MTTDFKCLLKRVVVQWLKLNCLNQYFWDGELHIIISLLTVEFVNYIQIFLK